MQIISSIGDAGGNWIEIEYDLATILAKFDEGNLHNNVKLTLNWQGCRFGAVASLLYPVRMHRNASVTGACAPFFYPDLGRGADGVYNTGNRKTTGSMIKRLLTPRPSFL